MSNNIVTYYPDSTPVVTCQPSKIYIEVEGMPAGWLQLQEIIRQPGPELNQATFKVGCKAGGDPYSFEEVAQISRPGQRVCVWQSYHDGTTGQNLKFWPLFRGIITGARADLCSTKEQFTVNACDEIVYRNDHVIDFIRCQGRGENAVRISTDKIIFNPEGKGNCSAQEVSLDGQSYRIFEHRDPCAIPWTFASALSYLSFEYLSSCYGLADSLKGLENLTESQILSDVNIFGLTPLAALDRICQRTGFRFGLIHIPGPDGQIDAVLYFYPKGQGKEIYIKHQAAGQKLDVHQTNLSECSISFHTLGSTTKVIGRGDTKRFESTFELCEGWDQSLEIGNYELYSPTTNPDFTEYKNVFRKYVLNEAGDYTGSPYNQGQEYDLAGVFGTDQYSLKRRRFWPCLSRNPQGESFGYYVEVSYNGGQTWQIYGGSYKILLDECGIYLSDNQLEGDVWIAICKDKLRFRITASMDSDDHLEAVFQNGPVHSSRKVRTLLFDLGNNYKLRKVLPGSVFKNTYVALAGQSDERDDTELIRSQTRRLLQNTQNDQIEGTSEFLFLRPDVWPGDIVKEIQGGWVLFSGQYGPTRKYPQIEKVQMRLDRNWSTRIFFRD